MLEFAEGDAWHLHERLVLAGVLTDPFRDIMPMVRKALQRHDFRVDALERSLLQIGAEAEPEVFSMQLIAELISVLRQEPGSWQERLEPARMLLMRFCCMAHGCRGPCAAVDALHYAADVHCDLSAAEGCAILGALCGLLGLSSR